MGTSARRSFRPFTDIKAWLKMFTRADFYLIGGKRFEWTGSVLQGGSPFYVPYNLLVQVDELSYLYEIDNFLYDHMKGITQERGWPHLWADSKCTNYAYYFFPSLAKVLFSMQEDDFHHKLYDPVIVKQGGDLRSAYRIDMRRPFPKMRLMPEVSM